MTYELAKQLKDAGFPQKPEDLINEVEYQGVKYAKPTEPSLSELIEACGERFHGLWRMKDKWYSKSDVGLEVHGSTPEEAVAKLWLELNKK